MTALTRRQGEALSAIARHIAETGIAPTRTELMAALGSRSRAAVQFLIERLIERGALLRAPYRVRGLELVDPFARPAAAGMRALFIPCLYGKTVAPGRAVPIELHKRPAQAGQALPPWGSANAERPPVGEQQPRHSETTAITGERTMPAG